MHRSFTSPSSAIRSLALLGLLATWGGSSSAFGQAGGATIADLARDAGADRTERLIAGAKREGMVVVYTSAAVEDVAVLTAAFEKKYGESHDYHPAPTSWDEGGLWILRPRRAFGWRDFPNSLTRWRFPHES